MKVGIVGAGAVLSPPVAVRNEIILRYERAVIPVGCYHPTFGVTLSLPGVIGREVVHRVLEPEMSDAEQQGLQGSADAIETALSRLSFKESRRRTA
jgi:malate/lactate dehydrogenase